MDIPSILQSPFLAEGILNTCIHSLLFSLVVGSAYYLMKGASPYIASGSLFTALVLLVMLPLVEWVPHSQFGSWFQFSMARPASPLAQEPFPSNDATTPLTEITQPAFASASTSIQTPDKPLSSWSTVTEDSTAITNSFGVLWILGIAFMICRSLRSHLKLRQLRVQMQSVSDSTTIRIWNSIAEDYKPGGAIKLSQINQSCSPFAFGLFRPTIVLPCDMIQTATPQEIQDALLHELNHITSRDLWFSIVQRIALTIYWWNPIVRWIEQQYNLSREKLCDIAVIQRTGNARAYATTLVTLADRLNRFAILPNSTHRMATSFSLLEERIKSIATNKKTMKTRRTKQLTWTACMAAILTGVLTLGIKATWASPKESVAILKSSSDDTVQLSIVNNDVEVSIIGVDGQTHSVRLPIGDKAKTAELQEIFNTINKSNGSIRNKPVALDGGFVAGSVTFSESKPSAISTASESSPRRGRSRGASAFGEPTSSRPSTGQRIKPATNAPSIVAIPSAPAEISNGAFDPVETSQVESRLALPTTRSRIATTTKPRRSRSSIGGTAVASAPAFESSTSVREVLPKPIIPTTALRPAIAPVAVETPRFYSTSPPRPVLPVEPVTIAAPHQTPLLDAIKRIEQRLNALENQQTPLTSPKEIRRQSTAAGSY